MEGDGMEELDRDPPPPDGEGMLGELRPAPPAPPDEPDEPPEEEGEFGEGMLEEDDCWLGQPPMSNAENAPTSVACTAVLSSRFNG